jgi:hypothetical protein
MEANARPVVVGQFDDAPGDVTGGITVDARGGHQFIDEAILEWSEPSEVEDFDEYEDGYDNDRVEDEDWEIAERGPLTIFLIDLS